MTASAQIAVYPLRQEHLAPTIEMVQQRREYGLWPRSGPMSTYVAGDDDAIFAALQVAFAHACRNGHVVMSVTLSNACPIPDMHTDDG